MTLNPTTSGSQLIPFASKTIRDIHVPLLAKQPDFTDTPAKRKKLSVSAAYRCVCSWAKPPTGVMSPQVCGESVHKAAGSRDNEAFVEFRGASRCALVYSFPLIFIWPLGWRLSFPIFPRLISFEEIIFKLWHRLY